MSGQGITRPSTVPARLFVTVIAVVALLVLALQPGSHVPTVLGASPLSITNVDSPDPVESGDQILYTIEIKNTGGAKVSNAILNDQFNGIVGFGNPPLLDAVSSRGQCTQNNTQVTCNGGDIEGNGTWTVTIRGNVTAPGGTTINNIATVTGNKSAQTFTNSASATTQVTGTGPGGESPDLKIGKNGPLSAAAGGDITYTLTVSNVGNKAATGIKVTDTVPLDTAFPITATATSLFSCNVAGANVTCTGGQINAGANGTITIKGKAPATGPLVNTSVVDPENTIDEGELGNPADAAELNNNSNTVTTAVSPIPPPPVTAVQLDKTGPAEAIPGQLIDYTIVVTNGNVGRADYVTMTDGTQGLQAASLQVVSAVASGGTDPECVVAAPTVTCTMTRLPAGGTMTVQIRGMVVAAAGTTITNNASVNANIKNKGYSANDTVQTIIRPGIDLTITKVDSPDPVCASSWPGGLTLCAGGLTYTFVVSNSGVATAQNVVVRDPIPAGLTYDDALSDAQCNETSADVITCNLGDIPTGGSETFSITMLAPSVTGPISNTVTVDPFNAVFESDETNNHDTETTQVSTGIDLTLDKFDAPPQSPAGFDPIATNGTETYVIQVDNIGTQDASNIRLRDTLPSGTRFISATATNGFTCTHDGAATGGIVECIGGSIRGTASEVYLGQGPDLAEITIKVFARPNVGTMTNEVRVDPLGEIAEVNENNNVTVETTTVTTGDGTIGAFNELGITKTGSPTNVPTSSVVTYTVVVTNTGTDPAVDVTVRDTLPAGFTYIEATDTTTDPAVDPNDFVCAHAGGVVTCSGATLDGTLDSLVGIPPARTLRITAFASSTPGLYTNQARVDPDGAIPEGNEGNNLAAAQTTVIVGPVGQFIDLTIVDKADSPDPVTPKGLLTYTITVQNIGTNPAFQVVVRDPIPAGTTFVSASDTSPSPGDFICAYAAGVVNCTGGTLDGSSNLIATIGDTRTIEIVVQAPDAVTDLINQAFIDPDNTIPEGDETNNQATEGTQVRSQIDLQVQKDGPTAVDQGSTDTYVLTIKNAGSQGAQNVVVRDALPAGLIPILAFAETPEESDFQCVISENPINVVTCEGTLDGSDNQFGDDVPTEVVIKILVFITAENGELDNEACIDPDDEITESNELNNCSTFTTVVGVPDLSINKSASASTVTNGGDLVYTLNVSNVGSGPTSSAVTVTDDLPSGLTLVSAVASNGFTCTLADPVVCDNGGGSDVHPVGPITTVTITTTVATTSSPLVNSATVSQDSLEVNGNNNESSTTTSVGGPAVDIALLSATDTPDPVAKGDTYTYTYLVSNGGTSSVGPFTIRSVFSSITGLSLVSATGSEGFDCDDTLAATFDCTGTLAAGSSTTISIVLQATASAPASVGVTVTVDPGDAIDEFDETNNDASLVTTISDSICTNCVNLVAAELIGSPDPVAQGAQVTFTLTVGNTGDTSTDTTTNPDALLFFDVGGDFTTESIVAPSGWSCVQNAGPGTHDCSGELGPGDGAIFTITATAANDADGSIQSGASIDPNDSISESDETDNSAFDSVEID